MRRRRERIQGRTPPTDDDRGPTDRLSTRVGAVRQPVDAPERDGSPPRTPPTESESRDAEPRRTPSDRGRPSFGAKTPVAPRRSAPTQATPNRAENRPSSGSAKTKAETETKSAPRDAPQAQTSRSASGRSRITDLTPAPVPPTERRTSAGRGVGRLLRIALPLAAIGLVIAVFFSSDAQRGGGGLPVIDQIALGAGIQVTNPRYSGATARGEPFSLSADVARPDGPDPKRIELDKVRGAFSMADDRQVDARADAGLFLRESNEVRLSGAVTVTTSDGYEMASDTALVDLNAMTLVTPGAVTASGPAGDLAAGSMRASEAAGGVIWFENGVTMTIRRLAPSRATGE